MFRIFGKKEEKRGENEKVNYLLLAENEITYSTVNIAGILYYIKRAKCHVAV